MAKAKATINGVVFEAKSDGGSGNLINIRFAMTDLVCYATVSGKDITIHLQHNGVNLTTSISRRVEVVSAIVYNQAAYALIDPYQPSPDNVSIFAYVSGVTFLSDGSEILNSGLIEVNATLNPTRLRYASGLSGAIIVSAVMAAAASKTTYTIVSATSSATASAQKIEAQQASASATGASTATAAATVIPAQQASASVTGVSTAIAIPAQQESASVYGVSNAVASANVTIGNRINAFGFSFATASINAYYGVSAQVTSQSFATATLGTITPARSNVFGTSTASANADLVRTSLTICDVVRDVLLLWGIEQPCNAPKMAKISAVNILNQAMQVLWNQAKDRNYWTQSTLSQSISSGVSTLILTDSIQNVVGPARLSTGETLVPLANISELENFQNSFLENTASNMPCAYFIERNYQPGGDPARCTLMLAPAPTVNITLNLDVVTESPHYTIIDLDVCPICPIPHKYVESLLLPVSRYLAMHSHLFIQRERQEAIVQSYTQARQLLDVADPLPGLSGENYKFRKEDKGS
jgi:hypothetical protein